MTSILNIYSKHKIETVLLEAYWLIDWNMPLLNDEFFFRFEGYDQYFFLKALPHSTVIKRMMIIHKPVLFPHIS